MAIKYNLTPIEVVKLFGYTEPAAKEELELFEKENHIKLPKLLFDFLFTFCNALFFYFCFMFLNLYTSHLTI